MKKLIHLSYDSPWNPWLGGGGAKRDWEIASRFSDAWNVEMWSGAFPRCDAQANQLPHVRWIGTHRNHCLISRILYAYRTGRLLRRYGYGNTIVSASPSIFAPIPALLLHPERTLLVVHHIVGLRNACRNYGPAGITSAWHELQLLCKGRHYVTVNNVVANRIRALNPTASVEFLPNGIDERFLSLAPNRDKTPTILFFGRLDWEMKGLDRLLAAFALVQKQLPSTHLVLAGRADTNTEATISSWIRALPDPSRVQLLTNVSEEAKRKLYAKAWVFCSPSRFEGWCIAGMEAQACGLPIVASTADGFLDSVRHGTTGILVPNRDASIAHDTASALLSLLSNPERRQEMSHAAREWAGKFHWDALAKRQEELCQELLDKAL